MATEEPSTSRTHLSAYHPFPTSFSRHKTSPMTSYIPPPFPMPGFQKRQISPMIPGPPASPSIYSQTPPGIRLNIKELQIEPENPMQSPHAPTLPPSSPSAASPPQLCTPPLSPRSVVWKWLNAIADPGQNANAVRTASKEEEEARKSPQLDTFSPIPTSASEPTGEGEHDGLRLGSPPPPCPSYPPPPPPPSRPPPPPPPSHPPPPPPRSRAVSLAPSPYPHPRHPSLPRPRQTMSCPSWDAGSEAEVEPSGRAEDSDSGSSLRSQGASSLLRDLPGPRPGSHLLPPVLPPPLNETSELENASSTPGMGILAGGDRSIPGRPGPTPSPRPPLGPPPGPPPDRPLPPLPNPNPNPNPKPPLPNGVGRDGNALLRGGGEDKSALGRPRPNPPPQPPLGPPPGPPPDRPLPPLPNPNPNPNPPLPNGVGRGGSVRLRGGGDEDVIDGGADKDIRARHVRDTEASNVYLVHALVRLQESLAGYELLCDRIGGAEAYDAYGHTVLDDAKNVKMTSTDVRCVRQRSQPGPVPEPEELETAADEIVAIWEQAMGLPDEEEVMHWESMNRRLHALIATSANFAHFRSQNSGAGELVAEESEGYRENGDASSGFVSRPCGGAEEESKAKFTNVETETNFLEVTLSGCVTMIRLRGALKILQETFQFYKNFNANCGDAPSGFKTIHAHRMFWDEIETSLEATKALRRKWCGIRQELKLDIEREKAWTLERIVEKVENAWEKRMAIFEQKRYDARRGMTWGLHNQQEIEEVNITNEILYKIQANEDVEQLLNNLLRTEEPEVQMELIRIQEEMNTR